MDDIRHKLPAKPTRFLDLLRLHIRESGLAYRTEQTYIHWVKSYIHFHGKQHPKDLGTAKIEAFLNHLAVNRDCSISTQRLALNTLVYLYKRFMGLDIGDLQFSPARESRRLPVVYSRDEIVTILSQLHGVYRLQVELMYGTGLRSAELLSLRIKDIDFGMREILVRDGKGGEDRRTILPVLSLENLHRQVVQVRNLHACSE